MSAQSDDALWRKLAAQGLVEGELPARSDSRSPWYVRVMLGVAAWMGALFLFSFVGAMFVFVMQNALASIAAGAMVCAGAVVVFRSERKSDFAGQFGLAVSLAGQTLIGYGLAKLLGNRVWPTALVMAAVQAGLFCLAPNFVHRVLTAWSSVLLAAVAFGDLGLHPFSPALVTAAFAWVWIREFEFAGKGEVARAGGYGLALAAMQVTVMHGELWTQWLFAKGGGPIGGHLGIWLGAILSAAVLLWAVILLLRREQVPLDSGPGRIALAGALILGLASLKAPGVGPAAAILVVGFANGNRVLAGLGILALLGYLSHFYYALHATLLEKSLILACTGVALLAVRLAVHRFWPEEAKEVSSA